MASSNSINIKLIQAKRQKVKHMDIFSQQSSEQSSTLPKLRIFLLGDFNLLLDLLEINIGHIGIITIEDLSQLLESGTPSLNVEEVDEAELDEDPNSVNQRQVPVVRKFLPGNWVGVTRMVRLVQTTINIEGDLLSENQRCLHSQVHDHDTLGAQAVGENLEGVGDEQTGPGDGVEHGKEPDEDDLWVTGGFDILGSLVDGGNDSPCEEHENHA
jgi:hypothetical protein